MERSEIESRLERILQSYDKSLSYGKDKTIEELEFDSLDGYSFFIEVETEFGCSCETLNLPKTSLNSLIDYLQKCNSLP